MPKICYCEMKFSEKKLDIVNKAITIIAEYRAKGYSMTLRQVYYQFVSRDWFPADWADKTTGSTNNQKSYDKLGKILSDARMCGLMDWKALVDLTREMGGNSHWEDPADAIRAMAHWYMIDKWEGQEYRPEVWVEKDAMEGIVKVVADRLDIPYFSCRGYTSLSTIWENAQRLKQLVVEHDAKPVIIHLGDHDPSGIDMSRDIEDRVRKFMDEHGDALIFKRVALNFDQIEEYNPPENPAKSTDSRYESYLAKFGEHSWELDALSPDVVNALISDAVAEYRDDDVFNERRDLETEQKGLLTATSSKWDRVAKFVQKGA